MAALPTGTVTFLFTDIERSTQRLLRLGSERYAVLQAEHQRLVRAACAAQGGVEVDTQGDAFFLSFPSAPGALAAAAAAQRALLGSSPSWPDGQPLPVRMGLHTGTPLLVGDHYIGVDVVRAARIAAAGHGGQVLLSQTTCDLAAPQLPQGAMLRDLGAHRLKDLREPEHLFQLVLPDLPADFPPLKSLDARPNNLPVQPTPLLGREREVAAVCALLRRDDVRLATLTGPGGIGKTRLSLQVAAELLDDFPDGVWQVRLSRLTDPTLVVPTIAQTLGLREQGSQPIAMTLRAHLAERRLLLVLDNFEQVVSAASDVAVLLAEAPGLKVLVTSRIRLRLRGERVYAVPPLPLAAPQRLPPPEQLTQYAAVALFVERAQAAQDTFTVTAANASAIADICARLDGLPLAIELAAARVRVLPPEALLARLAAKLKLLTGGARDTEERQQTMHATIAWSEALLSPEERTLFRRLAVFAGGCTLEAAEAVCVAPEGAEPLQLDLLVGLETLVDQSLVQQREEGGEPRFGMLHVIREYALERLEASGEAEALHWAHATYFLALAEQAGPELTGSEARVWLDRLGREHDNLRAALGWARERGGRGAATEVEMGLRLSVALYGFWWVRGHLREGRVWLEALLAVADAVHAVPDGVRARALHTGGSLAAWQGEHAAAQLWLDQATALAQAAGDHPTTAAALNAQGLLAWSQGDLERAAARFEECLELYRQVGDEHSTSEVLANLATALLFQGKQERAAIAFAETLAFFRLLGDRDIIAFILFNLGRVECRRGNMAQAEALGHEALGLVREQGSPLIRCAEGLEYLAMVRVARQAHWAARLLGAAAAVRETIGALAAAPYQQETEAAMSQGRAALGEEAWAAAYAAGRGLSLEEAIAEALDEDDSVELLST